MIPFLLLSPTPTFYAYTWQTVVSLFSFDERGRQSAAHPPKRSFRTTFEMEGYAEKTEDRATWMYNQTKKGKKAQMIAFSVFNKDCKVTKTIENQTVSVLVLMCVRVYEQSFFIHIQSWNCLGSSVGTVSRVSGKIILRLEKAIYFDAYLLCPCTYHLFAANTFTLFWTLMEVCAPACFDSEMFFELFLDNQYKSLKM